MSVLSDGIAAVVLAAGKGSRLGGGKLLLPWRGEPILRHVVDAALTVSGEFPVVLVSGHDSRAIQELFDDACPDKANIRIVENHNWRAGQSTSLQAGLSQAMRLPGAERIRGVMILLGDQPLVKKKTLALLAKSHLAAGNDSKPPLATAPFLDGRRGNPVIISPALIPEVMKLNGDIGARAIIGGLGEDLLRVEVDDPGVCIDVDSAEDYGALIRTS